MFFRNKNRNQPKEKYTPNYVILDREPIVFKTSPEDWRYAKEKKEMKRNKQHKTNITNAPVRIQGYQQNMIPSSGQNSEHLWRGQLPTQQELEELEEQEELVGKEKIFASEQKTQRTDDSLSVLDIAEFQFGIYAGDTLLHVTESVEEAETAIEFLLFNEKSPFKNLEISDISIVQKIPFKYGVCISKP